MLDLNKVYELGVIPVVALDNEEDALPLAKALLKGGINIAEVTFRTSAAKGAIKLIVENIPEMIVGAGTVTSLDQAKLAVELGAKFIVSPGFSEEIVKYCVENNIPVFPGCVTPTEIMMALKYNLDVVKFFPAGEFGGLKTIKALSGPFPNMKFIPTGGVNAENLAEFISNPKIFACGGTWLVKKELINNKEFDKIEELTKEAVSIVKKIRG